MFMVLYVLLYMMTIVYTSFSGFSSEAFIGFVLIWFVFFLVFGCLFGVGTFRVIYQICMTGTANIGDLFYVFCVRPMRFLGLFVLLILIQLLAYIPGIIISFLGGYIGGSSGKFLMFGSVLVNLLMVFFVSLQYSFSSIVLMEHPDYQIIEALRISKELMKGNRWRYVVLMLSFIGVLLLGYLSIGVGFLWLFPYFQCTIVFFYLDLKEEHNPPVQAAPDSWSFDMVQESTPTSETNLWL